jgi:hypothetical protein
VFRVLVALVPLVVACGGTSQDPPSRSPTYDYPAQAPTTADGDTVGADRQRPSDKLQTGPTVGSEGVQLPDAGAGDSDGE